MMMFFPGSIRLPPFDPIAFHLGPLAVRWYGLAYLLGFVLAYYLLRALARRGRLRMHPDLVGDLMFWLAIGVIAGGRLGWWLFYHHNIHPVEPEPWWEPIAIWHGGMSFHGGLVGVLIALWGWTKYRKLSLANVADCTVLATPIGLFFGRVANFVNGELWGRAASVPWAMIFPNDPTGVARHPSQLYEALLEGPVLLGLLWLADRLWRPRDGRIAVLFVVLYGLIRFGVEFTREPDPQLGYIAFGWLTMGQILSLAIVVAGGIFWMALGSTRSTVPHRDRGNR